MPQNLPLDVVLVMDIRTLQWYSSFSRKRSKKCCSASQNTGRSPKLGEADPGGLGACPQNLPLDVVFVMGFRTLQSGSIIPFPEKRSKKLCSASQNAGLNPNLGEAGSWD
jgi:hypothetical protein